MKKSPHRSKPAPFPKAGLWMWILASLFYFYDYLLQVSPGAMKPELYEAFALDAIHFGAISAFFHYAYGIMQIPAGMLLDKFGPRRILTLACALSAFGCFLFGIADAAWQAKFSRILMGLGASCALMGCFKIASIWFPPQRFAFITGVTITVGFLGAVLGLSTVAEMIKRVSWRDGVLILSAIGFMGMCALYAVIRDHRPASKTQPRNKIHTLTTRELWKGLKTVCRNKTSWYASVYSGLMFCPTLVFALWGVPFLVEAHGYDRLTAGKVTSLIYIGWVFGAPFFGWISDRMGKRLPPMYYASFLTLATCLGLIYLQQVPHWLIGTLLCLLGFFSSGFILSFVVVRDINPILIAGTALGFINTLNTLVGALFQQIVGSLLEWNTEHVLINEHGERIFSLVEYQNALLSLVVALVVALLLLTKVKETGISEKMAP